MEQKEVNKLMSPSPEWRQKLNCCDNCERLESQLTAAIKRERVMTENWTLCNENRNALIEHRRVLVEAANEVVAHYEKFETGDFCLAKKKQIIEELKVALAQVKGG